MNEPILFNLGLPFGQWPTAAAAFTSNIAISEAALVKLLDEIFQVPPINVLSLEVASTLQERLPDGQELSDWLQLLSSAESPQIAGNDARLCWIANHLAVALPEARFVVWVEHPARAYANWVQQQAATEDFDAVLGILSSATQVLGQLISRHASNCLVVALDEVIAHPNLFNRRLTQWLNGRGPRSVADTSLPSINAVALVLASHRIVQDRSLVQAQERLYGSCLILTDEAPEVSMAFEPAPTAVSLEALGAYSHLMRRLLELDTFKASAESGHQDSRLSIESQNQLILRCEELSEQLRQSQEELEEAFLQEQKVIGELAAERAGHVNLDTELQQARDQLARARTIGESAEGGRHAMLVSQEQQGSQVITLGRQNDLLLSQLHQVQEELEQYYLECQSLQADSLKIRHQSTVRVRRIDIALEKKAAPHRELGLVLHDVEASDRVRGIVAVRLVEHHDKPGLAFFQISGYETPLMAWQPTGREAESPFVLLIPDDEPSIRQLELLGAGDWQFLKGVAAEIALFMPTLSSKIDARWPVVAQRLVQKLSDFPPRFRFDEVRVSTDVSAEGAVLVQYRNVVLGDRSFPGLVLCWWPMDEHKVEFLFDEKLDEVPAFGCWPVDETGAWVHRWRVPLGGNGVASTLEWRAMNRGDRCNLLDVLDAMPAAAVAATNQNAVPHVGAAALLHSASSILRAAQRQAHGSRIRRIWRAVRGRVSSQ